MGKERLEVVLAAKLCQSTIKGCKSGNSLLSRLSAVLSQSINGIYDIFEDYFRTSDYDVKNTRKGNILKISSKRYRQMNLSTKLSLNSMSRVSITHLNDDTLEGMIQFGNQKIMYHTVSVYVKKNSTTGKYKLERWEYQGLTIKP